MEDTALGSTGIEVSKIRLGRPSFGGGRDWMGDDGGHDLVAEPYHPVPVYGHE